MFTKEQAASGGRATLRVLIALAIIVAAAPAYALGVEVVESEASLAGAAARFRVVVDDAVGTTEYRWDFGDGERTEYVVDAAEVEHTYDEPGHYSVILLVRDEETFTSVSFVHTAHTPLFPASGRAAATIVHDASRDWVCNVNPDNDTVSCVSASDLEKVAEVEVYQRPESLAIAPDGKLWVVHRDDYAVAIIDLDTLTLERGFRLPYASQPVSVVMSPNGDAAYVTLMATGELLRLDPTTGDTLDSIDVGPWPRGLAVSHDGSELYVSRFISPDGFGEVVRVTAPELDVEQRFELVEDTTTEDTDQQGRGLPNYLFGVALTPDGREAWVPSKKDNMTRGLQRDGLNLTQDNTVRPMLAVLDLAAGSELLEQRIDLDDRNLPTHVEFSPLGDYAFVTVMGSGVVEVRDAYTKAFVTALRTGGLAPRSSVLTPDGRLFVHAWLSRSVVAYDVARLLRRGDQTTVVLAEIPVVANEKLSEAVLLGKRSFFNSEDSRMSQEGYLSCASCHFEGFEDGRVWDFTDRGEGLRNTTSLLGRRGTGHGPVHWSANFDEIQDFEKEIRELFGGIGFVADELLDQGTRRDPLGDPLAGTSPELDQLAAYVASLSQVNRSPFRNPDGSLTTDAQQGEALFNKLGCGFCHAGPDFTDSARGALHDVGTLSSASGTRAGQPLLGIDTPTLLGVWETAPYLHDGSAVTLREVLTTHNPDDLHGYVSALSDVEIDQLVAYLLQLDGDIPPRRLPFEPLPPAVDPEGDAGADAGASPANVAPRDGGVSSADGSVKPTDAGASDADSGANPSAGDPNGVDAAADGGVVDTAGTQNCACHLVGRRHTPGPSSSIVAAFLLVLFTLRRRRAASGRSAVFESSGRLAVVAFALGPAGCSNPALDSSASADESADASTSPQQPTPADASTPSSDEPTSLDASMSFGEPATPDAGADVLPPVVNPDPELVRLGSREARNAEFCANERHDPFFKRMCWPERPTLTSLNELLQVLGLDRDRAFALTGNSTSLVARSVSALNPRIIIFPRVDDELRRPEELIAIGFVRGEQFVEIVSRDAVTDELAFYLLAFEQECSYDPNGCDLAALFTEEIERGWTAYSLYAEQELENTSFDCLSCHRPDGVGTRKILRMQELTSPWTHWFPQRFAQRTESDRVLGAQFADAHAVDRQFGGIPIDDIVNAIDEGSGAQLEALLRAEGYGDQPNAFDPRIEKESAEGTLSPTWLAQFDAARRGEVIAVPYPEIDVTDSDKRAAAAQSYRDVVSGAARRDTLLDLRDVFAADAPERLGFVPAADADGRAILVQMCSRCHDGRGDPSLSRSRFNVQDLDSLTRAQRENVIARLHDENDPMPPERAGWLSPAALEAVEAELAP